jgi:hypothetical protein
LVSAQSPRDDFNEDSADANLKIEDILDSIRKILKLKGNYGLSGLRQMMMKIDYSSSIFLSMMI